MGKTYKRKQVKMDNVEETKTSGTKKAKRESSPTASTFSSNVEVKMHPNSKLIDISRNINAFRNMREFLEQVFDNNKLTPKLILQSLVLFLLEVSSALII
jgi:hypothetical protein